MKKFFSIQAVFAIAVAILIAVAGERTDAESSHLDVSGWGLINEGKFDAALESFKKEILADGMNPEAHRGAGFVLKFKLKKSGESLPYYLKALELAPENREILAETALVYQDLKDYNKACALLTRSFERYRLTNSILPEWIPLALAAYHLFHLEKKNYSAGIPYLQLLLDGSAKDKSAEDSALDWLAYSHYQLKDYDRFLVFAKEYIQKGKNPAAVKNHLERLADYYYKSGELAEAKLYARKRGMDWWLARALAGRTIVIRGNVRLRMLRDKYYPNIVPGITYIPLPETTDYQRFISLESSPPYVSIIAKGPYNIAVYDFSKGFPEKLTMTITLKNFLFRHRPDSLMTHTGADSEADRYATLRDAYYDIDNPVLVKTVRDITAGDATPLVKAMRLHSWIDDNVTHILEMEKYRRKRADGSLEYNEANIPQFTKVSEILAAKMGHCGQISALYCGMLRSLGIPARVIDGLTISPDGAVMKGNCGEHYVTELYDDSAKKWFYVEPQFKNHFGINQFWHIVFGYEVLKKEYANMFDPLSLRWMEHYRHGNPASFIFEAVIEDE